MENTEKKNTVAAMSVMFARKMIESARKNGVEDIDGKKVVTVNGNKFSVWTEAFTRKDGKVMNRPHIQDSNGKDIINKFKVKSDVYAIVKACIKGKTESKRTKKPMDKSLSDVILKDMTDNKNLWKVEGDIVSRNVEGVGYVEIVGNKYELNGKTMIDRQVKVDGVCKIGGMNARNIYLRGETMKKKVNKKVDDNIEKENDEYFSGMMGGVKVLEEVVV